MRYEDVQANAVRVFEQQQGFAFTTEYEQSREWSDALVEAERISAEADA